MTTTQTCTDCGGEMDCLGQRKRVYRPDPTTMTDGQMAEQMAAEMGGPFEEGIHGETTIAYRCSECGRSVEVVR